MTHPYYSFIFSTRASSFSSHNTSLQLTDSGTLVWFFSLFCWMRQLVMSDDCFNSSFVSNQFKIIEQHICHCIFWRSFPYWLVHATPASVNLMAPLYTPLPACLRQKGTKRFSMVIFFVYVITLISAGFLQKYPRPTVGRPTAGQNMLIYLQVHLLSSSSCSFSPKSDGAWNATYSRDES